MQAGQNQIHNHSASTTASGVAATSVGGTANTVINDPGHSHSPAAINPAGGYLGNGNNAYSGSGGTNFGTSGTPYYTSSSGTGISAATSLAISASTTITSITASTTVNNSSGASESRPINISVLTCIKY